LRRKEKREEKILGEFSIWQNVVDFFLRSKASHLKASLVPLHPSGASAPSRSSLPRK
jgi:hypothetical protein